MPARTEMDASPAAGYCDVPPVLNLAPKRTTLPAAQRKPSPKATAVCVVPWKYSALLFGMPYLLGLAAEVDPTGRVAGAGRGFNNIGSALAPALAGAVLGLTGAYTSIGWTSVVAAAAAFGLVLLVARRLPGAR